MIRCKLGFHQYTFAPPKPREYNANGTPILRKRGVVCVRCGDTGARRREPS